MNKTATFEEDRLEYYTKGNVVDYVYVTIAAVYVLGNPICMSRKQLSSSAGETVVQIGIFALARREERIRGNEEACTGKCFLALHFIDQYLMCSGPRRRGPVETIRKSNDESPEL